MSYKIPSEYIDYRGLILMRPSKHGHAASDQDNAHLYTMYGIMLMRETSNIDKLFIRNYVAFVPVCEVQSGLYRRNYAKGKDVVSHDEYNGLAAFAVYYDKSVAKDIVKYGREHFWCYNDLVPGEKPSLLKAVFGSEKDRKILQYRRQSRDTFVYKVAAGESPSLFELLYFCASIVVKAVKDPSAYAKGSSQCLALLQLAIVARSGFKSRILALTFKYFCARMRKRLGSDYAHELFAMHFYSKEHPWAVLAKEFKPEVLISELKGR